MSTESPERHVPVNSSGGGLADTVTHPRFIFEPSTHPAGTPEALDASEASFCVLAIERGIRDNPDVYQRALEVLAATAETKPLDSYTPSEAGSGDTSEAERLLAEYFKKRYDKDVEFDEATERAISQDTQHTSRLQQSARATGYSVTTGVMSHTQRTHPDAERLRDRARISRLASYVALVIGWQEERKRLIG